jgi:hypothetical protein
MNIFAQCVPAHITDRELRRSFVAPLKESGAMEFLCDHPRGKPFAFITVLDRSAAQRFLSRYGVDARVQRSPKFNKGPLCGGRMLRCQLGREKPSEYHIRTLERDAALRMAKVVVTAPQNNKQIRNFNVAGVHCGMWNYDESSQLAFLSEFSLSKPGQIIFGDREVILLLGNLGEDQVRMDVSYHSCDNITINDHSSDPSLTFTLRYSPKFYKVLGVDVLAAGFAALGIGPDDGLRASIEKHRVLGFNDAHLKIAGACKIYRVRLSTVSVLPRVQSLLASTPKMPTHMRLPTSLHYPATDFERSFRRLSAQLTDTALYGKLPFQIRFQLDRIARNGHLSPLKTIELLPAVQKMFEKLGPERGAKAVAQALRQLNRHLPIHGPDTCEHFTTTALVIKIVELVKSYDSDAPNNPYELVKRHNHVNLVHRITITPTGIYLDGPDPEPANRVLRRYPEHTDHFARVVFCDEDRGPVRYDPRASQKLIYDARFCGVLLKPIVIAGMAYDFFGFSNSALRSHSCWFMAPIPTRGTLFFASLVLKELGNFESIRTTAKCAARIGQNFTARKRKSYTNRNMANVWRRTQTKPSSSCLIALANFQSSLAMAMILVTASAPSPRIC